ncbi:uncharacterized protein LY89DRAFT_677557 [Mollisia scopiformis]|uniref:Uncharacterized protein n=1 Tax=Mollisia scopiformis TaxID=149040 RepID=A0A132B5T7_MOLSC|nr:uncharacterized protein LY89DRAFT_677557 [Mollisia scopiformis]KUJ07775.1 hypothetical protein LY89DRAFT_677557 [Mollisia scopiformis]
MDLSLDSDIHGYNRPCPHRAPHMRDLVHYRIKTETRQRMRLDDQYQPEEITDFSKSMIYQFATSALAITLIEPPSCCDMSPLSNPTHLHTCTATSLLRRKDVPVYRDEIVKQTAELHIYPISGGRMTAMIRAEKSVIDQFEKSKYRSRIGDI